MAHFYYNRETGEAGIGGKPSREEEVAGEEQVDELDPHEVKEWAEDNDE